MTDWLWCPECGSNEVLTNQSEATTTFLDPSKKSGMGLVQITFQQTTHGCDKCGLTWTGAEGEFEEVTAERLYFGQRVRELSEECEKLRAFRARVEESLNSGDGTYRS